jgi:transposase-like protein
VAEIASGSRKEGRYICHECKKTFVATKKTPFYRLRTETGPLLPGYSTGILPQNPRGSTESG